MSWIWAALMPHPPIIIPEVGKGREQEAAITLKGVEKLCSRLAGYTAAKPDVLLVLSPHQPYAPGSVFFNDAERLQGSLSPFGAPGVALDLHTSADMLQALAAHLAAHGISVETGTAGDLTRDHGALVPLRFLASCFSGELPPVLLGSPIGLYPQEALQFGKALASFEPGLRCALLASGDLSHRLKAEGPGGYHPDGAVLDDAVIRALRTADPSLLLQLSPQTLHNAGECGLRSVLTLLGLSGGKGIEVLSYEGPFGVGYCNALWMPGEAKTFFAKDAATVSAKDAATPGVSGAEKINHGEATDASTLNPPAAEPEAGKAANASTQNSSADASHGTHPFPCLARETVRKHLTGDAAAGDALEEMCAGEGLWDAQKACFVSIKTKAGALRGCIGTILPVRPGLKQEIMANAVAAATEDPRFPPMTAGELDKVTFSVDVLTTPELVESLAELNPAIWGVIISKGNRRGLLLPDLPGVDTVQQQLLIAAQKAGISDFEGIRLERFRVERYPE